jgi:pimeloyl-ACP methyl ester carboxylesterase
MYESRHTRLHLADGRNLDVFVSGPQSGRVLVFHHGSPGSGMQFRAVSAAAHRLGLRLATTSRPGYGDSTRRKGRSARDVVADTEAVLNFVGIDRCLVAGWSGGGPHALACGALLPNRVAGMAVIASVAPYSADGLDWTAGMSQGNIEEFSLALQGEGVLRSGLDAGRTQILQATPADLLEGLSTARPVAERAVVRQEFAEDLVANIHEGLRVGADGWLDDDLLAATPWGFEVSEVTVPTRLWQGTEDHLVPAAHGEWLATRIPGVVPHFQKDEDHLSIVYGYIDQILQDLVDASSGRI